VVYVKSRQGHGDERVLEAAVNGQADAIVTFNTKDFGGATSKFGVENLLPREALALVARKD
jgi:predicted nucleic acid-binding protein